MSGSPAPPAVRAGEIVRALGLVPHPEGGFYREVFRSGAQVQPGDARPVRAALTTIDFLLAAGQRSAWHRVGSDEAWHLLEGAGLVLWLVPPALDRIERVVLGAVDVANASDAPGITRRRPRHVVPAGWWQAAEPLAVGPGSFAYVGATVGPGFDFADFAFGRDDAALGAALSRLDFRLDTRLARLL